MTIRYSAMRTLVFVTALAALTATAAAADNAAARQKERELIAVLKSDAPPQDKAVPCKLLAVYGTKDAVPALAPLLENAELASWARIALEAIPDPAADEALRGALDKTQGRLLIGAINSIGVRRDVKAVTALIPRLKDADAGVVCAAANALGRIGTPPAAKALEQSLAGAPAAVRGEVAHGCVLCAEKRLAEGNAAEAIRLYDLVRTADVPQHRIFEATRGAILARGNDGIPLLVEQLRSPDKRVFNVGLKTARELGGAEVAKVLAEELAKIAAPAQQDTAVKVLTIIKAQYGAGEKVVDVTKQVAGAVRNNTLAVEASNDLAGDPANGVVKELRVTYKLGDEQKTVVIPEKETLQLGQAVADGDPRQIVLIYTLGDVGQTAALPVVLQVAQKAPWGARVAAVEVLGRIGDASAVPVLLEAAQAQGELSQAAMASLVELKGAPVDAAIAERLPKAEGQARAQLLQLVGQRGIKSAMPTLLADVAGKDEQIRIAAIGALGMTAEFDHLGAMIPRLVGAASSQEKEAAQGALLLACTRMADRNATSEKLVAAMSGASTEAKVALIELLADVGGEKALAGVATAARSDDDAMQDAASRVLGAWMTADAAPVLLEMAKSGSAKYQIRALRGYLRIVRQLKLPIDQQIAMCREAEKIVKRDEEKKLILDALSRCPVNDGLAMALPYLNNAGTKAEAAAALVAVGEKMVQQNPAAVADAMKQVIQAGGDPKVVNRAKAVLAQAQKPGK